MSEPYATVDDVTVYHADCRDILPKVHADTVVTDPVWPGADVPLEGRSSPERLLRSTLQQVTPDAVRLAVQLGCDTDPRFLDAVPKWWDFFRVAWLEQAVKGHVGRLLDTGDVAYLFGSPPPSRDGHHVIPGRGVTHSSGGKEREHPTPRKLDHVEWLVKWWSAPSDTIVDPFAGSATTGLAAMRWDRKCVLIEVKEKHCETAARALEREAKQPTFAYA
jgi:site-specific DNA-methyltransferase (adenine-specific)/modification methylase